MVEWKEFNIEWGELSPSPREGQEHARTPPPRTWAASGQSEWEEGEDWLKTGWEQQAVGETGVAAQGGLEDPSSSSDSAPGTVLQGTWGMGDVVWENSSSITQVPEIQGISHQMADGLMP